MRYEKTVKGRFVERPNRFVAVVDVDGSREKVHVKNTGRCKEILRPNSTVYLEDFKDRMGNRKMRYSLVTVEKQSSSLSSPMINMDSQMPNKLVKEYLQENIDKPLRGFGHIKTIKPEFTYGKSRIDFMLTDDEGHKALLEVKGVTLEEDGRALFPDAPTERGVKHLLELEQAIQEGYMAYVVFVVQMKGVKSFSPNDRTHPAFGETLRKVHNSGVKVMAFDCNVNRDEIRIDAPVNVLL